MRDFLEACFSPANLPYTVLFILMLCYWLSVMVGALDVHLFDVDAGADVDLDVGAGLEFAGDLDAGVDVDAAADADLAAADSGGAAHALLHFLNIGEVPVTVLASVAVLVMWTTSMLANNALGNSSLWIALLEFPPIFILGLLVAKFATQPLRKLYRKMDNEGFREVDVVGRLCLVKSGVVDSSFGQAEVTIDTATLLVNVRTVAEERLHKGDEAIVVEYQSESNDYIISGLQREE